jgi:tRNA (cytidine32/uridine32-2'-O)-methyltransferase
MAVQVVAYELHMLRCGAALPEAPDAAWDAPPATQENMERFYVHLEETLVQIGFLNPAAPRQLMPACDACTAACVSTRWN